MAEARYFCPDCGSIDLTITNQAIKGPDGKSLGRAQCPNCSWAGPLDKTLGAVTAGQFWDAERVGDVLLRVLAQHGAGPVVQALEFVGLLPRKRERPEPLPTNYTPEEQAKWEAARNLFDSVDTVQYNRAAQRARDHVMQAFMAAALSAAFEEAEKQNRLFAIATETDIHPMLKEEAPVRTFGGDYDKGKVTNIKTARKRKKEKKR